LEFRAAPVSPAASPEKYLVGCLDHQRECGNTRTASRLIRAGSILTSGTIAGSGQPIGLVGTALAAGADLRLAALQVGAQLFGTAPRPFRRLTFDPPPCAGLRPFLVVSFRSSRASDSAKARPGEDIRTRANNRYGPPAHPPQPLSGRSTVCPYTGFCLYKAGSIFSQQTADKFHGSLDQSDWPFPGFLKLVTPIARLRLHSCPSCGNSGPLQSF
jgi:hypothetical protein